MLGPLGHDLLLFLVGGLFLYLGANALVRGAIGLARKLRVPTLIIGLTVVAYGTSAPELVVGITAALQDRGGIAFGNAVGSNIANLGLILGLTSIISPPRVDPSLLRRELPMMVMTSLAVPILLIDGQISRFEGGALLLVAFTYSFFMIRGARSTAEATRDVSEVAELTKEATGSVGKLAGLSVLGLAAILLGGAWFVDGASHIALALGLSERIVGLTIVAVGTSVPELATSLVAARRGHSDIAVGNVIGSNIFNVVLILGASGLSGPLHVSLREARADIVALVMVTLAAAVFLRGDRVVRRWEGLTLLLLYAATMGVLATKVGLP